MKAQIEYGLRDAQLGYWGLSAACTPGGGYGAYGVAALGVRTHNDHSTRPREGIIAPYASFLALPFAPAETLINLRGLAEKFPVYDNTFGFRDSVNVLTGQVSDRVLILDQGMILAVLDNVIGGDVLRRGFCAGPVEATIKPLIAQERFSARLGTPSSSHKGSNPEGDSLVSASSSSSSSSSASASLPVLLSSPARTSPRDLPRSSTQHLFEGFLAVAGLSAVLVRRARGSKVYRPSAAVAHGDHD